MTLHAFCMVAFIMIFINFQGEPEGIGIQAALQWNRWKTQLGLCLSGTSGCWTNFQLGKLSFLFQQGPWCQCQPTIWIDTIPKRFMFLCTAFWNQDCSFCFWTCCCVCNTLLAWNDFCYFYRSSQICIFAWSLWRQVWDADLEFEIALVVQARYHPPFWKAPPPPPPLWLYLDTNILCRQAKTLSCFSAEALS